MISPKLLIVALVMYTNVTGFAQENKKTACARKELLKAKADSTNDAQKFINQSRKRIELNQQKIDRLKVKNANENKEINDKYQERLLAIQEQNNELKTRIDNIATLNTSPWANFKRKFKYDMKELARIIEDND